MSTINIIENLNIVLSCSVKNTKINQPVFFRTDTRVVCETAEMSNSTQLNISQPIVVSWIDPNVPDEDTGLKFTYLPDPQGTY